MAEQTQTGTTQGTGTGTQTGAAQTGTQAGTQTGAGTGTGTGTQTGQQSAPVKSVEEMHDEAIAAVESWQANPSDTDLKEKAQAATKAAKEAATKAKEASAAEKKAAQEAAAKNKPPEKYDLKLPDGAVLNKDRLDKIATYAKERGLTNDQAQEIVERENDAVKEYQESGKKILEESAIKWASHAKSDKEIGGEKFVENAEIAKRVLKRFGSESLVKILDETGYGNHPELLRFAYRIGKAMGNDKFVPSGTPAGDKKDIASVFYGEEKK